MSDAPLSTGTVGLPPNVVFEPKESEPFTLQSVCTLKPLKDTSTEENNYKDSGYPFSHSSSFFLLSSHLVFGLCSY